MTFANAQNFSIGLGFEINQTRFRTEALSLSTIYTNPFKPDIGISAHIFFNTIFADKYLVRLKPGLSILNVNSDVTSSNTMQYINLGLETGFCIHKFQIFGGVEYSYLDRLISTFNKRSANLTFFANHRHFIHPTCGLTYMIDNNWSTHFRFVYFLRDLFNSGAIDLDGNIVGPVMVTPYSIGIGINYNFQLNQGQKS